MFYVLFYQKWHTDWADSTDFFDFNFFKFNLKSEKIRKNPPNPCAVLFKFSRLFYKNYYLVRTI